MQQTGILILTSPVRSVVDVLGNHLSSASKHVSKRLYVKLEPGQEKLNLPLRRQACDLQFLCKFIPALYAKASTSCSGLDIRLLLTSFKNPTDLESHLFSPHIDLALTDSSDSDASVKQYVNEQFQRSCLHVIKLDKSITGDNTLTDDGPFKTYSAVILGGTFDRLHNGHKILLSTAALRTTTKLIVGVTDGLMLKRKHLCELIQPLQTRMDNLADFVKDIDPTINVDVVPIYDPFGPAIVDADIDCIIVSEETKRGGLRVNEERLKGNMKELDILVVNLLEDPHHIQGNEVKMSSSNHRKNLLGTFLRKPQPKSLLCTPLCIAVVGGMMNGKSLVCDGIKSRGMPVIDTYEAITQLLSTPSSESYQEMYKLGGNIFNQNGEINMKNLTLLMLKDQQKREIVKSILFPAIKCYVKDQVKQYEQRNRGCAIFVKLVEFLQDGWENEFNQIWMSILPEQQRIEKLKNFYQISDDDATQILATQPSNDELLKIAHVVLSPQWGKDCTGKQIDRAFEKLEHWKIALVL